MGRESRPARRATAWLLLVALQLAPPGVAFAGLEGEQVVHGAADFQRDGDTTLITTHTQQTIVDYTRFDIGMRETVRIDQPDASSRILNNVLSSDPTRIDGQLLSNGQVWIVNPVGVFFGGQAIVDVGALVAAAGEAGEAFRNDTHDFEALSGPVEVAGGAVIRAAEHVLLVGESVANYGHISTAGGMIALVAGSGARFVTVGGRVSVSADPIAAPDPARPAIVQAGTLDAGRGSVHLTAGDAYSLAMNHTGVSRGREIELAGGAGGLVEVAGTLDASSDAPGETGGRIAVLGDLLLVDGASLDASGAAGGGEILIGGDAQGGGDGPRAQRTFVSGESVLLADATDSGDGGRIIVWADDATAFYGALSARGGAAGGDGGFAEISGARSLVSRGSIDLGADMGGAGTLLYDPARIEIRGGSADGSDSEDTNPPADFLRGDGGTPGRIATADVGDGSVPFVIFESELEGTDANIVLQASQSIETAGEFAGDDVVLRSGRDLSLEVVDAGAAIGAGEIVGIDVARDGSGDLLTFVLSDGGTFRATTQSSEGRSADIAVGAVETTGVRDGTANNVAMIATGTGSISVVSVDTTGDARVGDGQDTIHGNTVRTVDAGNVTLLTQTGSIDAGAIAARGGDASASEPGDGGSGGQVVISALAGPITVTSIDVSGGDGVVQLVDDGAGGMTGQGAGGDAGTISLVADLDPGDPGAVLPGGDPRGITVTGDLLASGGDGLGTEMDAGNEFGASGGSGGQIFVSAGHLAEEGSVILGSVPQPVRIEASGGDGTAVAGSAGSGGESAFTGAAVGAIRIEAHGDVDAHAELVATGGRAGFDAVLDAVAGPGGAGGQGGSVSLASVTGDVTLFDTGAPFGVILDGGSGRIDPATVLDPETGIASFAGAGGDAGSFTAEVAGDGAAVAVLADVRAQGGAGSSGAGGDGGDFTLTARDGEATLFGAEVSGGAGTGSVSTMDGALESEGVRGGDGGAVTVTTQAGAAPTSTGGDVLLGGSVESLGGAGVPDPDGDPGQDPNENHGSSGAVSLTSVQDVDAAPGAGAPRIRSGAITIAGVNVFASGGPDLVLSSSGASGPESAVDRATVQAEGDARVLLDDVDRFERVELIQTEASGDFDVLRDDGATVVVRATGAGDVHTIQELTTDAADPNLTYRLDDTLKSSGGASELIDVTTLEVASGAVSFGANGGKLANARSDGSAFEGERLVGRIQGVGAGPHVTTAGNVELYATNLGDETQLSVVAAAGASPSLEVGIAGDLDLDVGGAVAIVDVTQRVASGDIAIDLPGGGVATVDGMVVDDGASRIESARITRIDTTGSDVAFFFHLADPTASSQVATLGEPVLTVESGAVTLGGGGAGIATTGHLALEGGAQPAIDAGGSALMLVADSNLTGDGAIQASDLGTLDVRNAGALVLLSGEGVGDEAKPLRTSASASGELVLAGSGGSGDFRIANESGAIVVERLPLTVANGGEQAEVTLRGLYAGGEVVLDNGGRDIVLGEVQPDLPDEAVQLRIGQSSLGLTGPLSATELRFGFGNLSIAPDQIVPASPGTTTPHVVSGGGQRYVGTLLLANPRSFDITTVDPGTGVETTETTALHEVRLQADGDVVFAGDVDTHPALLPVADPADRDPASLEVSAPTTFFEGHVGSVAAGAPGIDALTIQGDALFTAGAHTVTVASADFRRIDGPGALALRGLGPDSLLVFRGDVGAAERLAAFDADADLLLFDRVAGANGATLLRADRIVADSVSLNAATPAASVPVAATIADRSGGLTIQSATDVTIGRKEKLSVAGGLTIEAAGTATVGDLAATELRVDASRIVIQGREPGDVDLPAGATAPDLGVDWVANDILTNVIPEWEVPPELVGVASAPVFALGSGGIRTGGALLPFDVIRFTRRIDEVRASDFFDGDRVLDLTGSGPRVVSDPSSDVPRSAPPVVPAVSARFSETRPAAASPATGEDVLATVRCRSEEGKPCLPERPGDALLTSERIREIVERYHTLVASAQGGHELAAAFEPVGRLLATGFDGRTLHAALASRRDLQPARERLDALAIVLTQVSLLGLDDAGAARVRGAIASDFAAATGVAGLDAEVALEAVRASGVGALP